MLDLWLIIKAATALAAVWLVASKLAERFARVKRVGKSRLRTLFTRETPMRWAMDHYSQEGYTKYHSKGESFVSKVFGLDYLVLPPKYLQDLKTAPAHSLSFMAALNESFNVPASAGDLFDSPAQVTVVSKHLNSQFNTVVPLLADEAVFAIDTEMGTLKEWKSFNASDLLGRIIHRTTSRLLVGPTLCRDETYLDLSNRFSGTLFISGTMWNWLALGPLRAIATAATVYAVGHMRVQDRATQTIIKEIKRREETPAEQVDMLQWVVDCASDEGEERQAHHLLHLTLAASTAAGMLLTNAVYQLLMFPEYVEPLREEVERVLEMNGGEWTDRATAGMVLMDSFLRETMRMYPAGSMTGARTVMEHNFRFHDGMELPRGQKIIFPALAVQMDPKNYPNPHRFDGFRFVKGDGNESSTSSATAVDPTFLQFGYGKHACPGRFYAVRKVKVVLGMLLGRYDFMWDGVVKTRPKNVAIEAQLLANPDARVLFRSRSS